MNTNEWIEKITTDTPAEISKLTGIPKRTIQHQVSSGKMSVENLVKIGAAYGHHPVETLIEWEVIDSAWRSVPNIQAALKLAPEEWLADEVLTRMLKGPQTDQFDTSVDELLERRSKRSPDPMSDASGSMPSTAVADDSPDEDRMREEEDGDWTDPNNIP